MLTEILGFGIVDFGYDVERLGLSPTASTGVGQIRFSSKE